MKKGLLKRLEKNLKVGPQSHNQSYITRKQKLMIKKCDLAVYMVIISLLTLGKEKLHAKYFAMNKTNAWGLRTNFNADCAPWNVTKIGLSKQQGAL